MSDESLILAILKSRKTLDEFASMFNHCARAQTDFMVVVLEEEGDSYVPVGILVEEVSQDGFSGRRVANTLTAQPEGKMTCRKSDVVDWRYVDTFEMEGGAVYRELYARLEPQPLVQSMIRDVQPFLIEREKEEDQIDDRALQVFRAIANSRHEILEELTAKDLSLSGLTAPMPRLTFDIGRRVVVFPATIPEYGARYGDSRIIDFLVDQGTMKQRPNEFSPLVESSWAANVEATKRLLELGSPTDCKNRWGSAPLHVAVKFNHLRIVQLLLKHGADCNVRDVGNKTPLFHVESVEIAKALIDAGADVNAVDDTGATCLDGHLFERQNAMSFERENAIVRLLVEHGAEHDGTVEIEQTEPPPDAKAILSDLADQGNADAKKGLELIEVSHAVDYGCVLPVKLIPKSALSGIYDPVK